MTEIVLLEPGSLNRRRPVVAVPSIEDARDRDLVRQVRSGDEEAFRGLFRRYGPLAKGLAHKVIRQPLMAEEVVQEAFQEDLAESVADRVDLAGTRERVRRALQDCPECLRLESEYRDMASHLATVAEPLPLSSGAEEALIRAARSPLDAPVEPARGRLRVIPEGRRAQRWVAAAAVAAAIALLGGLAGYAIAPKPAPLAAVTYRSGDLQLSIVYAEGQTQALAIGSNLPTPANGRVYELWYQPSEGAAMVPAGTFVPRNGTVVAPVQLGESFVAVAMSVEPPGGSPQPTTEPIFVKSV
jgi:anti-sigma-K factor RskA